MSVPAVLDRPVRTVPGPSARRRLSPSATLWLLGAVIVVFLAGSSAPTPLYEVYQARWGFSPITVTVVFAIYAAAVLSALLTLGKLSDHVGRRPVLFAAIGGQIVAMALFATADGVGALIAARVVQGIATGAAAGAVGAAMLDVSPRRGTLTNAVVPGFGTALGSLVSGLFVQYLPAPTHLVYLVLLGVLALQAVLMTWMPETVTRKPGALATLVPEIALPRAARGPFVIAAPVLFAVWALAGLYASLGPALVRTLTHSANVTIGGLSLFVLAFVAALTTYVLRNLDVQRVMFVAIGALVTGVSVTMLGIHDGSAGLFFVGTAVAGVGFGAGFQGPIRMVLPAAEPHQRAGLLSVLYVVAYLGFGAPAIAAGLLVVHGGGLTKTALEYGAALVVLAAVAFVGLLRGRSLGSRLDRSVQEVR